MRITIFAATGGIGTAALEQAVDAGHQVTAVVRNPRRLTRPVPAVTADLSDPDPEALRRAVAGADAVLSGLGPRKARDAGITAPGTRAIVDAMLATGVRRIIVVSAAPVGTVASPGRPNPPKHDPGDGPLMRYVMAPLIKAIIPRHYADLALMEDVLRDSGLDWTSVRPPRLTDKPVTGRYRVAYGRNVRGGVLVSRADVAHLMLRLLDDPESVKQAVALAN
jgi:putative NADH-flavin reductase